MTSVEDLVRALPIRDIHVRSGTYGDCGGVAIALVDLVPGSTEGVEGVDAATELHPNPVDSNEHVNRQAGRLVVEEAVRVAGR